MIGWYYEVADRFWPNVWGGRIGVSGGAGCIYPTSLVLVAGKKIDEYAKHDVIPLVVVSTARVPLARSGSCM